MKLSSIVLFASVATAGAFSPQSAVSARSSSTSTTARHATIEKQETELVPPKSVAELMSQKDSTMDMYGINVQKTYG
jgi:hypothetical protein